VNQHKDVQHLAPIRTYSEHADSVISGTISNCNAFDDSTVARLKSFARHYNIPILDRDNNESPVPVKYSGRVHCVTGKPLPLDTDYQAALEGVDASEWMHRVCL
jgi:hypothetical protein